ncbi:preprotein translocase subunit YajC [Mycobacterium sp. NPDC050853]|uniref:preprotein translocase subunit YajC n=1 Tax=Mycobacterium sp. NPDC050853 TaxID=3155160 RepID=UPI0033E94F6C
MESFIVFLPLILVMGAFLYFANRRQRKALDATISLHDSLAIGDRVHTTSGLQGTITAVTDDDVDLEIAPGVVTRWMKLAVRGKIEDSDEDTDDTVEETSRDVESSGVELTKD